MNVLIYMLSEGVDDRPSFVELEEHLINTINDRDELLHT